MLADVNLTSHDQPAKPTIRTASSGRLSDFVDAQFRHNLPVSFQGVLDGVKVEMVDERGSFLRVRPTWIGDWWFGWVESRGIVRQRATDRSASKGHALLMLSVNGQLRATSSEAQTISPGQLSLNPGGTPFELFNSGEMRYLVVHIPLDHLEAAAPGEAVPYLKRISAFSGPGAVLSASLRAIASEAADAGEADALRSLLPALAQLVRQAFKQAHTSPAKRGATERMTRILEYLETHLADASLCSETVSRACGISERQLFRDFATRGDRFNDTLRGLRLERAALHLIAQPSSPVTKIANSCGFQNASSFSRSFHAAFSVSPRVYRRLHLCQ